MRKILLLTLALCLAFSSLASAANWQWVASTDDTTLEIDSQSITKADGIYNVWAQFKYADFVDKRANGERISFARTQFKLKNTPSGYEIMSTVTHSYNKKGDVLLTYPAQPWASVIPETLGEAILKKVLDLRADADKEELEQVKKEQEAQVAEEKKAAAERKKKQDTETAANVARTILGGIF